MPLRGVGTWVLASSKVTPGLNGGAGNGSVVSVS